MIAIAAVPTPVQEVIPVPKSENRVALDKLFHRLCKDFGQASSESIIKVIIEELGSLRVTVPDMRQLEREERDRRIFLAFRGDYSELEGRFRLTTRQLRNIVEKQRNDARMDGRPPEDR